jgi:hypothetical protein
MTTPILQVPETPTPSPSDAALLGCLSSDSDATLSDALRRLDAAGWIAFTRSALRHRVAPIVHRRLDSLESRDVVPPQVRTRLASAYELSARAAQQWREELTWILRRLHESSIPSIILKGSYLGPFVYEDGACRPMFDLDILARREDIPRVTEALLGLGYVQEHWRGEESVFEWNCHIPPFSRGGQDAPLETRYVEVHWTIELPDSPFPIEVESLWRSAVPITLDGAPTAALPCEDLLVHLSLHAAFHHGYDIKLKHLCDFHSLVTNAPTPMDWRRVSAIATAWRGSRLVYTTLLLARDMLGTPIPAEALDSLAHEPVDAEIVPIARAHILLAAPQHSAEWVRARAPLNAWLQDVTGKNNRGGYSPGDG